MKKMRIQWFGLAGVLALLSYLSAALFAPHFYPGYDWLSQAVSDLSALTAPSRNVWLQLAGIYEVATVVSVVIAVIYFEHRVNKLSRIGIYLFALSNVLSIIGYRLFPLSDSGHAGTLLDMMHIYVMTPLVILLSLISLGLICIGSYRTHGRASLGVAAGCCLLLMLLGAIGTAILPKAYFGIPERISVFAVVIFNAILGFFVFRGDFRTSEST